MSRTSEKSHMPISARAPLTVPAPGAGTALAARPRRA